MRYPNDETAEEREARLAEEEAAKVVPGAPQEPAEDETVRPVEGGQPPKGDPNAV
jgi:hypothetical protein